MQVQADRGGTKSALVGLILVIARTCCADARDVPLQENIVNYYICAIGRL